MSNNNNYNHDTLFRLDTAASSTIFATAGTTLLGDGPMCDTIVTTTIELDSSTSDGNSGKGVDMLVDERRIQPSLESPPQQHQEQRQREKEQEEEHYTKSYDQDKSSSPATSSSSIKSSYDTGDMALDADDTDATTSDSSSLVAEVRKKKRKKSIHDGGGSSINSTSSRSKGSSKRRTSKENRPVLERKKGIEIWTDSGGTQYWCLSGYLWFVDRRGNQRDNLVMGNGGVLPKFTLAEEELAKDLATLQFVEQQRIEEEIYGAIVPMKEDPKDITDKLQQMEDEIQIIQPKAAYHRAVTLSPQFVAEETNSLLFLRADWYDPQKAAQRKVQYYTIKEALFGSDQLVQNITMEHLLRDPDCREMFTSGCVFLLPQRDRNGRGVVLFLPELLNPKWNVLTLARLQWYLCMVAAEDESVQSHGLVLLVYNLPNEFQPRIYQMLETTAKMIGYPLRYAAVHWCLTDSDLVFPGALFHAIHRQLRLRTRLHAGSYLECKYKLERFGIPQADSPVSLDGEIDMDVIHEFIKSRRDKQRPYRDVIESSGPSKAQPTSRPFLETATTGTVAAAMSTQQEERTTTTTLMSRQVPTARPVSDDGVVSDVVSDESDPSSDPSSNEPSTQTTESSVIRKPNDKDVLAGMSGKCLHPGNRTYHELIDDYAPKYNVVDYQEKTLINMTIVQIVKKTVGGRFLKKDGQGGWTVLTDDEARKKVAHAFRHRRERKSNHYDAAATASPTAKKPATKRNRCKKPKSVRLDINPKGLRQDSSGCDEDQQRQHYGETKGMD